jgi:hypothetical protein
MTRANLFNLPSWQLQCMNEIKAWSSYRTHHTSIIYATVRFPYHNCAGKLWTELRELKAVHIIHVLCLHLHYAILFVMGHVLMCFKSISTGTFW